jgi:hypothetical protein
MRVFSVGFLRLEKPRIAFVLFITSTINKSPFGFAISKSAI